MKTRRILIVGLAVILILLTVFLLYSFTVKAKDISIRIYDGETLLLDKTYKIDSWFMVKLFFINKNKLSNYYEANNKDLALLKNVNDNLFDDIKNITNNNQKPPKDATYKFNSQQKFEYTTEENGYLVNQNDLLRNLFSDNTIKNISIKKIILYPTTTVNDLQNRTKLIGSFVTDYSSSSENRKYNIKIATEKFNGKTFLPNEQISFNTIVGKRTAENGFKNSIIIDKGKFVEGVGGGVCQVSTTLYNAFLYSGLKIEHATAHSLPVAYVPKSFDAMVSSSNDLLASNNTLYPIFVKATTNETRVSFEIYGYSVHGYTIVLHSDVQEVESHEYEIIKENGDSVIYTESKVLSEPKNGYKSKGYADYYFDGKLIKTELIRTDFYKPQKGKILFFNNNSQNISSAS